jgi:hypothetical protein
MQYGTGIRIDENNERESSNSLVLTHLADSARVCMCFVYGTRVWTQGFVL